MYTKLKISQIRVPNGKLGILIRKEPNLGIVIYASKNYPCQIKSLIGSRLMAINRVRVNDLEPWIVANLIQAKVHRIFTVIKNVIPVATKLDCEVLLPLET